jgi:hypothetical protein
LYTVFGEVETRKAEAFLMLVSGSQPYINRRKKSQPSQNGEKYNDKDNAYNKHVATSQLLTKSDPHIESSMPCSNKIL